MPKELELKLKDFFRKYKKHFDDYMISYVYENILDFLNGGDQVDLLSQVAYAIGEKPKSGQFMHDIFLSFLKDYNGLDQDIFEVACGMYPILADKIDKYQQESGKGTITACDPLLITTRVGNIKLSRKFFTEKTDIQNFSLITGFFPCEATLKIIENANYNDKDFTVALCGCTHFNDFYFYMTSSFERWKNHVYSTAKETLKSGRTLDITSLDGIEYPIISSKRKILK